MTTETPGTTRLSDEHIDQIELFLRDYKHPRVLVGYPGAPLSYARELLTSHRALAAELARVEGERDRYREVLEGISTFDDAPADAQSLVEYGVELARAALNGAAK